ncbi:MAG TPA: hypothetical protein VFZ66_27845 [Herpetosiphonaceae bacterium]
MGPPYKPTPYVAWVIDVPDAVADVLTTKVFPILLGGDATVPPIAAITDRPEWTIRALLHPTPQAQPLLDLDTLPWASLSVQLHWKPGRCAGLLRASADDRERLRAFRDRGWTVTLLPAVAAKVLARPVRLHAYPGAPWLGPRSTPTVTLPTATSQPPAAPSAAERDAGSAAHLVPPGAASDPSVLAAPGAPGLLLGVTPDGTGVTLAWHALTLALDAPLARQRQAVLALLRRALGQGMGVLAILPRLLLTDGVLAPWAARIRLLDGRDLWASAAIPWHALERDVLQAILQAAGARQPLPDPLPDPFAHVLAQVGLADLATEAVRGLTARPGDDLAGVLLAGGGVILVDQGTGEGDLLANLVLAACAAAGDGERPLLIIRPAALAIPDALGTRAIQLVLGGNAAAHATLRAASDGWLLTSTTGGAEIRLSADLTAEPTGLDLALHTSLVTTLDGPEHHTAAAQDDADDWYAGPPTTVEPTAALLSDQAPELPDAIATEEPDGARDVPRAAPVILSWDEPTPATVVHATARTTNEQVPAVIGDDVPDTLAALAGDPFLGLPRDAGETTEDDLTDPAEPALVDVVDAVPAQETAAPADAAVAADDATVHLAGATLDLHAVLLTPGVTLPDESTWDLPLDDPAVDLLLEAAPVGAADTDVEPVLTDLASLDDWDVALLDPNEVPGGAGDLTLDDLLFVEDDEPIGFVLLLDTPPGGDDPLAPDATLLAALPARDEPRPEPAPDRLLAGARELFGAAHLTLADTQTREGDPAPDDLLLAAATDDTMGHALPLDGLTRQDDETSDEAHQPASRRSVLAARPRRRWMPGTPAAPRRELEPVAAAPTSALADVDQESEHDGPALPLPAASDLPSLGISVDDPTDAAPQVMSPSPPEDESSIMVVTSSGEADPPYSPVLEPVFSPLPAPDAAPLPIPSAGAVDGAVLIGGDDSGLMDDADDSIALRSGAPLWLGDITLDGEAIWTRWRSGMGIPAIVRDLAAQHPQLDPRALRIDVKALIDRLIAERLAPQPVPTSTPPRAHGLGASPDGEDPPARNDAPDSAGQPDGQLVEAGTQEPQAIRDAAAGRNGEHGLPRDAVEHPAADDLPATVAAAAGTSDDDLVLVGDGCLLAPEAPAETVPGWSDARIWTTWQAGTGIPALVRQIAASCPERDPATIRQAVKAGIDRHLAERTRLGATQAAAGVILPSLSSDEPFGRAPVQAGAHAQTPDGMVAGSSRPPSGAATTALSSAAGGMDAPDVAPEAASASGLTAHADDDAIWTAWQADVPLLALMRDLSGFDRGAQAEAARERIYQVVVPRLVADVDAWDIVERVVANKRPLRAQEERYDALLQRMNRQRYPAGGAVRTKTHDRLVRIMRAELARRVAV